MLKFLDMLKGNQPAAGSQNGQTSNLDNFFKALGADKMGQAASQGRGSVGMQYANQGLGADQVPNMMQMVNQMGQANQQQQSQLPQIQQINPLLQMLMSGGK